MNEVKCNGAGEMPGHEGEGSCSTPEYDEWLESHHDALEEFYVKDNPEQFPTSESMVEIDDNGGFQDYVDAQWEIYEENKGE